MRTYSWKTRASKQTTSAETEHPVRAKPRQDFSENPVLRIQRTIGNHATQQLIQRKSEEQETASTTTAPPPMALPQSFEQAGFSGPAPTPRLRVPLQGQGPGQPLPDADRASAQSQYGHDFASVRLHSNDRAAELAAGLSSKAFAFGDHIFFGRDYFNPFSAEGRKLLVHELGHVSHYLRQTTGALSQLGIRRTPHPTTWSQAADGLLQGITPPATAQLRALILTALRDEAGVSGTRPQDYQLPLSRGVRIRTSTTGTAATTAHYDFVRRIIEVGTAAAPQSIADALQHAIVDTLYDPTPAGPISALPTTQQQQVTAERHERDTIISDMFRGMSPQPAGGTTRGQLAGGGGTAIRINLREQTRISLRAFSISQLHTMKNAGLRFWRSAQQLPPGYDVSPCTTTGTSPYCVTIPMTNRQFRRIPRSMRGNTDVELNSRSGGIASYQNHFRMILLNRPDNQTHWGHIRHELAHAWDDIRNDTGPAHRLDNLNPTQRLALIRRLAVDRLRDKRLIDLRSSGASRRQITRELGAVGLPTFHSLEAGRRGRTGIPEMYRRYRQGLPRRILAFDGTASQGHSLRNPMEFYAEGFNVFHSLNRHSQASLLRYAPELYDLLEREALSAGRVVPSRTDLQTYITNNAREFPPRRPIP